MELTHLKSLFAGVQAFRDLTDAETLKVLGDATSIDYRPGFIVFDQGGPGDALFLIQSGRVRLVQADGRGGTNALATLEAGQVFGEMALLEGGVRSARAIALDAVRAIRIPRDSFQQLRREENPAAFKLLRGLAGIIAARVRSTDRQIAELVQPPRPSP